MPEIQVRQALPEDVDDIYRCSSQYARELGFVSKVIFKDAQARGELLYHPPSRSFCQYHKRRDGVSVIYEICVPVGHRRQGIAAAMLRMITRPIQLKCPVDNPSNRFYAAQGFELVSVEQGKKRKLNVWLLS